MKLEFKIFQKIKSTILIENLFLLSLADFYKT